MVKEKTEEELAKDTKTRKKVVKAINKETKGKMPDYQVEFLADVEMIDKSRFPGLHRVVKHRKKRSKK